MSDAAALKTYVQHHFVEMDTLARASRFTPSQIEALIKAKAIPEPAYSIWPNGAFSSPIGGRYGQPSGTPVNWYSADAIWWLRNAMILDAAPEVVSATFQAAFCAQFLQRLQQIPEAILGYSECYRNGRLEPELAHSLASREWQDWAHGGYAVCLRKWNVHSLVTKTIERARIITITDAGRKPVLSDLERAHLLQAMERLDAVLLPFAPHQRPFGTPGLWIDAMLVHYGLGHPDTPSLDTKSQPGLDLCA